jgi:hypothetical protein
VEKQLGQAVVNMSHKLCGVFQRRSNAKVMKMNRENLAFLRGYLIEDNSLVELSGENSSNRRWSHWLFHSSPVN